MEVVFLELETKLTSGLFWQLCTGKITAELTWVPKSIELGCVNIEMAVCTWQVEGVLPVQINRSECILRKYA